LLGQQEGEFYNVPIVEEEEAAALSLELEVSWVFRKKKKELLVRSKEVKGRVQCFSVQVVMNKCFLPNP